MQEKKFLSFHELIAVGSLLFGMLFGAGNLIFPLSLGKTPEPRMFLRLWAFWSQRSGCPFWPLSALLSLVKPPFAVMRSGQAKVSAWPFRFSCC